MNQKLEVRDLAGESNMSEKQATDLMPCSNCGGKAEFNNTTSIDRNISDYISCECGMETNVMMRREAEKVWNARPQWIEVKDGLPEENGAYLVTAKTFEWLDENAEPFVSIGSFYGGEFREKLNQIIAWMPLPQPFKKGDK